MNAFVMTRGRRPGLDALSCVSVLRKMSVSVATIGIMWFSNTPQQKKNGCLFGCMVTHPNLACFVFYIPILAMILYGFALFNPASLQSTRSETRYARFRTHDLTKELADVSTTVARKKVALSGLG